MSPTVSVIIPCFNSARFVAEAIESVLAQTFGSIEVLLIDDGSDDRLAEVVEKYTSVVRMIRQENRGVSSARNLGLHHAKAEFVLFLDADDTLEREAVERLVSATERAKDTAILMGWVDCDEALQQTRLPSVLRINNFFPAIIHGNFGPNHTRLVARGNRPASRRIP